MKRQLKDDFSIVNFILLDLITCGIYGLWYIHTLAKEVNELCREDGVQTSGLLALILLSLVTCGIYSIFWWYRIADMLQKHAAKRQIQVEANGSTVLICFIVGMLVCGVATWVGQHMIFKSMNTLAADYNEHLYTV